MYIKITIILLGCIICNVALSTQTKAIAHRGYWDCPGSAQNSIVALYKAHEIDVYGSEFDVLITADGVPVVNHDDNIQGHVVEKTNYEDLRDLKIKNGEILPTMEQYLVHGKANKETKLILEIKPHSTKEIEDKAVKIIVEMVQNMELEEQTEYISFSLNICKEILKTNPNAKVFYLRGELSPKEIKEIGLTGIDYHYSVFEKNPEWINESKTLGIRTNAWTVNDETIMKKLISAGIDYITTDKPSVLQKVLGEKCCN